MPDLGIHLVLPDGWSRCGVTPEMRILPGDAEPMAFVKRGTMPQPLLLLGQVPAKTLGDSAPGAYPADFVAQLQERFGQIAPPPEELTTGPADLLPVWLRPGRQLVARGRFPEVGNLPATATFAAGVSATGQVWVVVSFTATDQDRAEVAAMLASLGLVGG